MVCRNHGPQGSRGCRAPQRKLMSLLLVSPQNPALTTELALSEESLLQFCQPLSGSAA
ncbi:hypothetical protein FB472_1065 [Rhodoglobus vestalii]|uniref:Uncharacterized protein n=1 Tax=Rhodoglobus vestalii TaxID=193384 RepID=A0A8H2K5F6_9MICO|nr:hypothetical protein FB472_1065 [Rhodoglobus vestalii]